MIEVLDQAALISRIVATLRRDGTRSRYSHYDPELVPVEEAEFALIVGAGFSHGVVPMVTSLMNEWIGDYYYPDQDQSSLERDVSVRRDNSKAFWKEFNEAARRADLPTVALDRKLPADCAEAYNRLFEFDTANALFAERVDSSGPKSTYIAKLMRHAGRMPTPQPPTLEALTRGSRFVRGFLRYVLAPGSEHGDGVTGSNRLNPAHAQLASILALQQTGRLGAKRPFCRTVFTTNFDSLLQCALSGEGVMPIVSDRPERGFDPEMFEPATGPIQIVHVHGSVLRNNPASSTGELTAIARTNAAVLADYLATRHVLVVGHSGWNDAVVAALAVHRTQKTLYWCDMHAGPSGRVTPLLDQRPGPSAYVQLGQGGADELMTELRAALCAA